MCAYECLKSPRNCSIQDDVRQIWEKLKAADGVILAVPTYYGMPSALFKAIIEREQVISDWVTSDFRDLDRVWKAKTVAIIVVSNRGGENVKSIILQYFPPGLKN